MKLTTNFQLQEFVSPECYAKWGDAAVDFINPQLAPTAQAIRDSLNRANVRSDVKEITITVNDWIFGGSYTASGLRDAPMYEERDTDGNHIYAGYGAHFYGCGEDMKFNIPVDDVFNHIMNNQHKFPYIARIEDPSRTRSKYGKKGRDWLHVEVSSKPRMGEIEVFKP